MRIDKLSAVLFNAFRDNRIINNRHQFYQMLTEYMEEQCPVEVKDFHQKTSFLNQGSFPFHLAVDTLCLSFYIFYTRRKQSVQSKFFSFRFRKCGSLVQECIVQ